MRGTIGLLALLALAVSQPAEADAREDYVLLTAHADSAMVRKRSPEGRVLEFVDVLGRKNRCAYDGQGRIDHIRYATESGDYQIRFVHNKRGELTSMVLADGTIALFRNGSLMPSTGKASAAESYAAALEHWLSKHNGGV